MHPFSSRTEKGDLSLHLLHIPYVQLIPDETLTPLHYSREELLLLASTPLYGHAVESRRNGRNSCVKATQWLLSHHQKRSSTENHLDELCRMLDIPQTILAKTENGAPLDIELEAQDWGIDEEQWPILKHWRWAETAYGR